MTGQGVRGRVRLAGVLALALALLPAIAVAGHAVRAGRRWSPQVRR